MITEMHSRIVTALIVGTTLAAASVVAQRVPPRSQLPVLTVEVGDYAFTRLPSSVPAGWTRIRLVNRGTTLHHMQLNRLEGGHTVREMLRDFTPGRPLPTYLTGAGGPSAAWAGQTIEVIADLRAGAYAVICWVPAADHKLHVQKGMIGQLTVTGAPTATPAAAPVRADVVISAVDYNWVISKPVGRGRQVIQFENRGPQPHELVIVRLADGKRMTDARDWAERGQTGELPGAMLNGVAAVSPGHTAFVANDFTPGRYALLCFVPDQKDGKGQPHVHFGMMKEFTIQ
jgi:uncharacterized cupredoxin-like copper-binding protein